jgi:uncharacterized protein (DUF2252 family)
MTYTILACIIGAMAGLIVHLTRERAYWKNMAMAEGRKRLTKDVGTENAHNAEIRRLNDLLRKYREKVAELERNNKILRRMNEQLRRGSQKKEETTCP